MTLSTVVLAPLKLTLLLLATTPLPVFVPRPGLLLL
jgi:hypothetical protein